MNQSSITFALATEDERIPMLFKNTFNLTDNVPFTGTEFNYYRNGKWAKPTYLPDRWYLDDEHTTDVFGPMFVPGEFAFIFKIGPSEIFIYYSKAKGAHEPLDLLYAFPHRLPHEDISNFQIWGGLQTVTGLRVHSSIETTPL